MRSGRKTKKKDPDKNQNRNSGKVLIPDWKGEIQSKEDTVHFYYLRYVTYEQSSSGRREIEIQTGFQKRNPGGMQTTKPVLFLQSPAEDSF